MVDQDPVKCNGCNNEEETRELHGAEQDAAAADTVNKHKVGLGEEVRACNDSINCHRIGEANESEQGRGIVHQRIKASKLTDSHKTTSSNKSTEVCWSHIKLL